MSSFFRYRGRVSSYYIGAAIYVFIGRDYLHFIGRGGYDLFSEGEGRLFFRLPPDFIFLFSQRRGGSEGEARGLSDFICDLFSIFFSLTSYTPISVKTGYDESDFNASSRPTTRLSL